MDEETPRAPGVPLRTRGEPGDEARGRRSRAGRADLARPAGHRRRGRLRGRPRAGAHGGRRAAAPHAPRAARRAARSCEPDGDGPARVAARDGRPSSAGTTRGWSGSWRTGARWPLPRGWFPRWRRARHAGAPRGTIAHGSRRSSRGGRVILRLRDRELDLTGPAIMGIVNATPDSFSDRQGPKELGRARRARPAAGRGRRGDRRRGRRVRAGPTPRRCPSRMRSRGWCPLVERLAADGALVSVDTWRGPVARAALAAGAR